MSVINNPVMGAAALIAAIVGTAPGIITIITIRAAIAPRAASHQGAASIGCNSDLTSKPSRAPGGVPPQLDSPPGDWPLDVSRLGGGMADRNRNSQFEPRVLQRPVWQL